MWIVSLLLGVAAVSGGEAGPNQPFYGIARAGDGDSLEINGKRLRLYGIDAPEFDQTCSRGGVQWACGAEAADQLAKLVTGREVRCVPKGLDQYQRVVARCTVGTIDVNTIMVERGYAVAFRKYSTEYIGAEEQAKAAKRGLWSGTFVMPSEVRAATRAAVSNAPRFSRPRAKLAQAQPFSGGCVIKGNKSRRGEWIYHLPGMPYYDQTRPEEIFCSEADARAAGYRRAIVR